MENYDDKIKFIGNKYIKVYNFDTHKPKLLNSPYTIQSDIELEDSIVIYSGAYKNMDIKVGTKVRISKEESYNGEEIDCEITHIFAKMDGSMVYYTNYKEIVENEYTEHTYELAKLKRDKYNLMNENSELQYRLDKEKYANRECQVSKYSSIRECFWLYIICIIVLVCLTSLIIGLFQ